MPKWRFVLHLYMLFMPFFKYQIKIASSVKSLSSWGNPWELFVCWPGYQFGYMRIYVNTYIGVFVSFRPMESVRYRPTLTLKSNFKATPVHFVKVDRWSHLDSSGTFFIHLIPQKHMLKVSKLKMLKLKMLTYFDFFLYTCSVPKYLPEESKHVNHERLCRAAVGN